MVVPADIKSNLHNLLIADEFSMVKGYDKMADLTTLFFAPKPLNQLHLLCGIARINAIPPDVTIPSPTSIANYIMWCFLIAIRFIYHNKHGHKRKSPLEFHQ